MTFVDCKKRIESEDQKARDEGIHDLLNQYLSGSNPTLHRIATREFFNQLRPFYSIDDVVARTAEKIDRRLRNGTLKLVTEKKFLAYVTRTIQLVLLDLNRKPKLPVQKQLAENNRVQAEPADPCKGPRTVNMDAESSAKLQVILEEMLSTEDWYLIRRHYFEAATYDDIADEVLPQPKNPQSDKDRQDRYDTIRMRIHRIRKELKEREEDLLPFLEP